MRKGLYTFLVCLLISTAFWFLIRFSEEFNETIVYPVVYNYPFQNKIIVNQPDEHLILTYKIKGFNLYLNKYLNKRKPLILTTGKVILFKEGERFRADINTVKFTKQIAEQLDIAKENIVINPDTVRLYFIDIYHKTVTVKLNLMLNYEKQYELNNQLKFEPESIRVTGTKRDLDAINYIETEFRSMRNLNKSLYLTLNLVKPKTADRIDISTDKITCFVPVEKFTEETVIIPVTLINNTKGKSVRIFPDKVEITYLVSLNDYNKVNSSMFSAIADYKDMKSNENNRIKVKIRDKPGIVKITRIKPDKVEFIIW
jgi:hypothetical protein